MSDSFSASLGSRRRWREESRRLGVGFRTAAQTVRKEERAGPREPQLERKDLPQSSLGAQVLKFIALWSGRQENTLPTSLSTPTPLSLNSGFAVGPLAEASTGGPATPPWKECPICKEHFPADSDKDVLEDHMDGHFYYSTQDSFTFE